MFTLFLYARRTVSGSVCWLALFVWRGSFAALILFTPDLPAIPVKMR